MTTSELPELTTKSRYVDTAEVAKLIRPALRAAFPGVKFSVRISRYSGGSSIDIKWTDGPTPSAVEKITNSYQGGRFEGMTDCAYSASCWLCREHGARTAQTYGCDLDSNNRVLASRCCASAELVNFGASHVSTRRELSPEFTEALRLTVARKSGMDLAAGMDERLPEGSLFQYYPYDEVRDGVYRLSRETAV